MDTTGPHVTGAEAPAGEALPESRPAPGMDAATQAAPIPQAEPQAAPGANAAPVNAAWIPAAPVAPRESAAPPSVADGILHALDHRAVALNRTVGWIVTACVSLVLLAALGIVLAATDPPTWVLSVIWLLWGAITFGLGWTAHFWPEVEHQHAAYRVDGQVIEIRRGVFWRAVITVPRSRVQHTDVSQGPLERRHGLGTLSIHTAGTDHAQVQLHGLDHATALAIRDHLLPGQDADAV